MIHTARLRSIFLLCAGSLLALLLGWALFSLIGRLLAPAAVFIIIRGVRIPQTIIEFGLRIAVIAPIFVPWCVLGNRCILSQTAWLCKA